ncbi:hypothetical protein [Streptomyces luteogriseus]|uniref:hypothetical protein n=1 Tax=Streptomyces luteogriseus TaxID=68233 RepID=UPI002E335C2B|nr:hypothetical protein [Streptomyces luteogriseus]WTJ30903.1 hypothetical protein OID52_29580 [Streptomyces luteogriseus]
MPAPSCREQPGDSSPRRTGEGRGAADVPEAALLVVPSGSSVRGAAGESVTVPTIASLDSMHSCGAAGVR